MFYHQYSTYIQASYQAIRGGKKTTQKDTNIPKVQKNDKNKKMFTKKMQKVYDFPPLYPNLTLSSFGAKEPQPAQKARKTQNKTNTHKSTKKNTYIHKVTHKSKSKAHPINNKTTNIHSQHHKKMTTYKTKNTTNNKTQHCTKAAQQ